MSDLDFDPVRLSVVELNTARQRLSREFAKTRNAQPIDIERLERIVELQKRVVTEIESRPPETGFKVGARLIGYRPPWGRKRNAAP